MGLSRHRTTIALPRIGILACILVAGHAMAGVTNLYHTNRVFTVIATNFPGTPSAYEIYSTSEGLTNVVLGTNIAVNTNGSYATEYEGAAWGYDSATNGWAAALSVHSNYYVTHGTATFDNVGWVKGSQQSYENKWGAYLWLLQNTVAFQTSPTNVWVSPGSGPVTSRIGRVLVGSIGDFPPMTNVVDVGPWDVYVGSNEWTSASGFPGIDMATEEVFRANFTAYYELVSVEFQAREGKINYGFDPPCKCYWGVLEPVEIDLDGGTQAWCSVALSSTSDVVKLVVIPSNAAEYVELVVASGSGCAAVSPTNFSAGETDLEIKGLSVGGSAVIEARDKDTADVLATLNVLVLTQQTVEVGIYRIEDSTSPGTMPVGGASDSEILAELNDVFGQACIQFQLVASGTNDVDYDANEDGKCQQSELGETIDPAMTNCQGELRLCLIRKSGWAYTNYPAKFIRGVFMGATTSNAYVFVQDSLGYEELVAAHEFGHQVTLAAKGGGDDPWHDPGPWPPGEESLMRSGDPVMGELPEPGRWLRHEDWKAANEEAIDP